MAEVIAEQKYGAQNFNPIPEGYHDIPRERIQWGTLIAISGGKGITAERIRFLGDRNCPDLDLSYCDVIHNGTRYEVTGAPFDRLPKRRWKTEIVRRLKDEGVFLRDLFGAVSILI